MVAIDVQRLRKTYGDTVAVDDLSFTVDAGTVTGLLGPNGAGKTTAVNCLTTLIRPDGGTAVVAGHDVRREPALVREQIAVTGQSTALDAQLTGWQNLMVFGRLLGLDKRAARARAAELVERLDLGEVAGAVTATYSGGLRRRLDLAVSLLVPRPVLFLDEPTTGLDPRSRQQLWQLIRELRGEGRTILLTTQYLEEADELADHVLLVDGGRLRASGTPAELKRGIGGTVCEIRLACDEDRGRALHVLTGLASAKAGEEPVITLPADQPGTVADVVRRLTEAGIGFEDVAMRGPTLDDVFFALTDAQPAAATAPAAR